VSSNRFHAYTPADRDVKLHAPDSRSARGVNSFRLLARRVPLFANQLFSVNTQPPAAITRPTGLFRLKRKLTKQALDLRAPHEMS
jgi:hypothetical protein